ncbi:MAG TPA: threonylcarbamoyl-AMP synthase [Aquificaceae bacterium]|nr:threonylcarbamoyl-AMP synthase [Aquificaceae bacterium]
MIVPVEKALEKAVEVLEMGEIVVAPTDTLYGMLTDATNEEAVKRLYTIRRPSGKPFLILIPDETWINKLCLKFPKEYESLLKVEGLTLILRTVCDKFSYINKGSLAVRIPRKGFIKELLKTFAKPVVAPSVNPEGKKPAETISEAVKYFGEKVALYVDAGEIKGKPSTILDLKESIKIVREGKVRKDTIEKILNRKL